MCGLKISVREKGSVTGSCEYRYETSDYTKGGSCYVADRLFAFQERICSTDFTYVIMLFSLRVQNTVVLVEKLG